VPSKIVRLKAVEKKVNGNVIIENAKPHISTTSLLLFGEM